MTQSTAQLSQSHKALEHLRQLIFSGELAAGTDHLETELAKILNMSRTPVREATLMLEAQGLLEVRPRKGVRILSLTTDDMHEIYEILTELESLAAFLAAKANYDEEALSLLALAIKKMEKSVKDEEREQWAKADQDFHSELVRLAGNSRISAIVSNFNDQVRRARSLTLYLRPMPKKSNEDHRNLYNAIVAGNATEAQKIHRAHRVEASKMIIDLLTKHGFKHF